MSVEDNKQNVRRLNDEVFNGGNLALVDELMAPNYVLHTTPEVRGPEGAKKFIAAVRKAFPDLHITIEGMVAEKDMAAIRYTMRGTFNGEYMGITPTRRRMNLPTASFARFKHGKQVEVWPYLDSLVWYQQLGIPIPRR